MLLIFFPVYRGSGEIIIKSKLEFSVNRESPGGGISTDLISRQVKILKLIQN